MANIVNQYGQVKLGVRYALAPLTSSYLLDTYGGATVAYSLRKLRTAYSGPAIRVRRSSDNTTLDVGFNADGTLDTTSMLSFVGAGNGFVSIWYDQSGNGSNLTQTTSANQPQIVSSGALITRSGKPYFTCSTTQFFTLASMFTVINTPYSMWMTYEKSATGNNSVIGSTSINYMYLDYGTSQYLSTASNSLITISPALSINTRYVINGLVNKVNTGGNNLTSSLYINNSLRGTKDASSPWLASYASTQAFPSSTSGFRVGTITTNEWIVYTSDQSTNRDGISSNINSYYSIYATDSDAQAFITAAAITGTTQQSAINTLVTDLKAANIWTKMKAIYPFVGGTAAQHRFNLKSPGTTAADFYLDFIGGGSHSANGYLPNGTTAYADTKMIPSVNMTANINNMSMASYVRNTPKGALLGTDKQYRTVLSPNYAGTSGSTMYYPMNSTSNISRTPSPTTLGLYMNSRTNNTTVKLFRNGTLYDSTTNVTDGQDTLSIYISARNDVSPSYYSNSESAFASIGDGLTDAEALAFYNAVQTYQTTLGRAV